jgi:pantetheine-phosphate adenylyltransferase
MLVFMLKSILILVKEKMKMKTIAIYPGSFNPFTIGHLNILEKAKRIFGNENVIIAIGRNPSKDDQELSSILERVKEINEKTKTSVEIYETFLHEYIESLEKYGFNVVVVRGLRNGADLDYEVNQMRFINDFKKDVNVVYITCDKDFEHISSSAVRSLQKFKPGSGDIYLI